MKINKFNDDILSNIIFSIHRIDNVSTLTLIDFTTENVLGTISYRKVKSNYEMVAIVSETGYGFLIINILLMVLYSKGLMACRDAMIKPAAIKLFNKLYDDDSVSKLPSSLSNEYSQDITDLFIEEFDDVNDIDSSDWEDSDFNLYLDSLSCKHVKLNFVFKKEPNNIYNQIVENNEKYATKSSSYYYNLGKHLFQQKYNA